MVKVYNFNLEFEFIGDGSHSCLYLIGIIYEKDRSNEPRSIRYELSELNVEKMTAVSTDDEEIILDENKCIDHEFLLGCQEEDFMTKIVY